MATSLQQKRWEELLKLGRQRGTMTPLSPMRRFTLCRAAAKSFGWLVMIHCKKWYGTSPLYLLQLHSRTEGNFPLSFYHRPKGII
jgi:hypothetical protein